MTAVENQLISVIIPVFNTKEYLENSVQSVLDQTHHALELILIDDGSTDGSGDLCDSLAKKDGRIKVIHKANSGQSSARNCGLDIAAGEYVGFVDSDDSILPRMYEELLNNMIRYNAQISCCGTRLIHENGTVSQYCDDTSCFQLFTQREALTAFPDNRMITGSLCDKLFSRDVFKHIRLKEGSIFEDFLAIPYCLLQSERIIYTAEPLYNYRYTPQSTMRGHRSLKLYDVIPVCAELVELYKNVCPEALPGMENQYIDHCLTLFYVSYGDPAWDDKRRELQKILTSVDKETFKNLYLDNKIKIRFLNADPERYVNLYEKLQHLKAVVGKRYG